MDFQEINAGEAHVSEPSGALPFPFKQHPFCRYESIEKTIEHERVLVVDNLLRDENDLSEIAIAELGKNVRAQLKIEAAYCLARAAEHRHEHRPPGKRAGDEDRARQ